MAMVKRLTIDSANMFPTDGRERKQGGATKGIVVDSGRCYRAMRPDETCSPIPATWWGSKISRQCAAMDKMPWAGCADGGPLTASAHAMVGARGGMRGVSLKARRR